MLDSMKGIKHRFLLLLESEMKSTAPEDIQNLAPPRFAVGGAQARKDPRTVRLDQLVGVSNKIQTLQLPPGWVMLHQYIYVVQQNTDEYGWQYRSTWSNGSIESKDEEGWVSMCDESKNVRRRLWMTIVVKQEDVMKAKRIVYEELNKSKGEALLQDVLSFYFVGGSFEEPSWRKCRVLLYQDRMELYAEFKKIGEVFLLDCEVQVLVGKASLGRDNAFRIRHPNGSVDIILSAENREDMLRWVKTLKYELAIITPDLNFEPFFNGPPTGTIPEKRVLLCSKIDVSEDAQSDISNPQTTGEREWESLHAVLEEKAMLLFSGEKLQGRFLLSQAVVRMREEDREFSLKLKTGLQLYFRAESKDMRSTWVRTLKRQIRLVEYKKSSLAPVSDEHLSHEEMCRIYSDDGWSAQENFSLWEEEQHQVDQLRNEYYLNLVQVW
jgi:hypothetical protein